MGCEGCRGGSIEVTECPREVVDAGTWEAVWMARMLEQGAMPVAGGVLDQATSGMQAMRAVLNEQARAASETAGQPRS